MMTISKYDEEATALFPFQRMNVASKNTQFYMIMPLNSKSYKKHGFC